MYLEKLEIQGFKSFANKNVLVFSGLQKDKRRGLTAIVGPNGSGKSNIADAVRWALGEQSMKNLRGKKSDDIIFCGSDKKSKLSMAEVSLHLNNEDGQAPLDYSQIVLTRRLYRDGHSEYLINNSKVRLFDVQMLLAKANFGQKTYSVIGQGMVEGFLNTSLAERKEFFDEATGVKQYQIKRESSLHKLKHSLENLQQAEMLLGEIKPRLNSLTKQVHKLEKREIIEKDLQDLQLKYYGQLWQEIHNNFTKYNEQFLQLEQEQRSKEKKIASLNKELALAEQQQSVSQEFAELQTELNRLQNTKNSLQTELNRIDARLEIKLEAQGKFDLAWLNNKEKELKQEQERIVQEIGQLENWIKQAEKKLAELNNDNNRIEKEIKELQSLPEDIDTTWQKEIEDILEKLNFSINDLEQAKNILAEVKIKLQKIIASTKTENRGESRAEKILSFSQKKEELAVLRNDQQIQISSWRARAELLLERKKQITQELDKIVLKLKQNKSKQGSEESKEEKSGLQAELAEVETKIRSCQEKIASFNQEQEKKTSKIFTIQKELQGLQAELNQLNLKLNELKISATRYETKLEDLEIEIRSNVQDLKQVRNYQVEEEIDLSEAKVKIEKLKGQLEAIGGIDPAVEKEYQETKERYDFLDKQSTDLKKAIRSLEEIIKELDITIKEKFDKEFKVIAQKFSEYFKILFSGGNAKIIKVMAEEAEEMSEEEDSNLERIKFLQKHNATGLAGIEIQATPPGKKIKSISMLSGGERALVAIALISAIISANPSPFVVLDEVDAALDEANSERLAKILDDLSTKTQFIVITHNRASMRRANIIYGVTMQDDSVSKLLSVKLEDTEKVISKNK